MELVEVLPVPPGKLCERLSYLENGLFLGKCHAEGGQGESQAKARKQDTRLPGRTKRLGGKPAELEGSIMGKAALQLHPVALEVKVPVVADEGEGLASGGVHFCEGLSWLHDRKVAQCRDAAEEFDPKVLPRGFGGFWVEGPERRACIIGMSD